MGFQAIAFDADDTLWHTETLYVATQDKFKTSGRWLGRGRPTLYLHLNSPLSGLAGIVDILSSSLPHHGSGSTSNFPK
jgi:hypothetical protein